MNQLALILLIALAGFFLLQAVPVVAFVWKLRAQSRRVRSVERFPRAAVILCLRGEDPFLKQCLEGLFQQDYPDYEVHIVVDHREDPAWTVVEQVISQSPATKVRLQPLTERYDTCSLKGSSIIQAVSGLDDSCEVVAFLDSDTLPHASWLRELVAPLTDQQTGVASGNRWYMPKRLSWGSLVRYIWNAAAVVQMYWNRFTWGGSVAMKACIARHPDLIESWKSAVSTDTVILEVVRREGFGWAFVPSLLMPNRESCALPNFFRWVQRQLIVTRLYHRGWIPVVTHGVIMTLLPVAAIVTLAAAATAGRWDAAVWAAGGILGYWLSMALLLGVLEAGVRPLIRARGEPTSWLGVGGVAKFLLALPLTQFVYFAALMKASFMKTVQWRGVSYLVEGPRRVRLVKYQPYQPESRATDTSASL